MKNVFVNYNTNSGAIETAVFTQESEKAYKKELIYTVIGEYFKKNCLTDNYLAGSHFTMTCEKQELRGNNFSLIDLDYLIDEYKNHSKHMLKEEK